MSTETMSTAFQSAAADLRKQIDDIGLLDAGRYLHNLLRILAVFSAKGPQAEALRAKLAQNGVTINTRDQQGQTMLYRAALYGYLDYLEEIVRTPGVDMNARCNIGMTPLMAAMIYIKRTDLVRKLLDQDGIDVTATANIDGKEHTALSLLEAHERFPGLEDRLRKMMEEASEPEAAPEQTETADLETIAGRISDNDALTLLRRIQSGPHV